MINKKKIADIKKQKYTTEHTSYLVHNSHLAESNKLSFILQGQTACFARSRPSLVVVGQSVVSQTPRERQLVLL